MKDEKQTIQIQRYELHELVDLRETDASEGNGRPEKMTVPSASYFLEEFWHVFHFQTQLYCPYQSETLLMCMRGF